MAGKSRGKEVQGRHFVLPPPGVGNIGDTALLQAFVDNVHGKVVVILPKSTDYNFPTDWDSRVQTILIPRFIYGDIFSYFMAIYRLGKEMRTAKSLSILGADVMDGGYNKISSINRANFASIVRSQGIPVGIIGFSWNASPDIGAKYALSRASKNGVKLYLRDPISANRAIHDGLSNVNNSADIVFMAKRTSEETYKEVRTVFGSLSKYAIVNISGLLHQKDAVIMDYVKVIHNILEKGLNVVLLIHVSRLGADDKPICQAVADHFNDSRVYFIDTLVSPANVRGLVRNAEFVITGRMHLSIMAFSFGIPSIVTNSQGKVSGLVRMLDCEDLCLELGPNYFADMMRVIDKVAQNRCDYVKRITEKLSIVQLMAQKNFEGL